ncbi:hypothetical protein NNJEOMEG_01978 [Fundidesulfovibrio magnetotacticus]|uniref:Uncharacterized protein n=1 Tax=Fundidesulfovibrio magnetotacticus TaxID=2730080 RepID=A0A6V8LVM0_9BACT|nr:YkgJ family cysteine cluster protein [Fundidesulfovibrio magnetotacticus]GFK94139.1 hypothetical protein NNJEOMEG_01978 [Fundidesulfovibrio magnetotacticus]
MDHAPGALTCRRCGRCCQAGPPALHKDDLELLAAGAITRDRLVTLRAGELARDNVRGGLAPLARELVRLASAETGHACVFHEPDAARCAIHHARPAECRLLFCRDPRTLVDYYSRDRLTRADIVPQEGALAELARFHDKTFPAARIMALARRAAEGSAAANAELSELASAEDRFRRAFLERTGTPGGELDFLFGRALPRLCAPFGVSIPF